MTVPIHAIVGLAHVKSVPVSIAFYETLGFRVARTFVPPGQSEPVWAWLQSGDASLMVGKASGPFDAGQQAVLFYLYVDDVAAKHAELVVSDVVVSRISYPFTTRGGVPRGGSGWVCVDDCAHAIGRIGQIGRIGRIGTRRLLPPIRPIRPICPIRPIRLPAASSPRWPASPASAAGTAESPPRGSAC